MCCSVSEIMLCKEKQFKQMIFGRKTALKDKSGVGIIVNYSRDYTGVNGV